MIAAFFEQRLFFLIAFFIVPSLSKGFVLHAIFRGVVQAHFRGKEQEEGRRRKVYSKQKAMTRRGSSGVYPKKKAGCDE
jgi:hypothetical protein